MDVEIELCEAIKLNLRPGEIRFRVKGDSMEPLYENGGLLVCRPVDKSEIKANSTNVYVINSRVQEPVLKFIKKFDQEILLLSSTNPMYSDSQVHWEDIHNLFLVVPPRMS